MESRALIDEMKTLIETLDPSKLRDQWERRANELLERMRARLHKMNRQRLSRSEEARLQRLRQGLHELAHTVEDFMQRQKTAAQGRYANWKPFSKRLQSAYKAIATQLRAQSIAVPQLRPTNHTRSLFHVSNGVFCLLLIQFFLTPTGLIIGASIFASFAWSLEILRKIFPSVNRWLLHVLAKIAHPHEAYEVNSATWFGSGLVMLAVFSTPLYASVAVMVLALADPAAGYIGRRYGRTRLVGRRTLEGSLTFVVVGALVCYWVFWAFYPQVALSTVIVFSVVAGVCGALAELFTGPVDDNLSIPLAIAGSLALTGMIII